MTEAVYTATAEYIVEMEQRPVKHRVSVSGVLKRLGVSRSGYNAWKKRCPSAAEKHRGEVKEKILKIYEDSHQNYGAPKITHELWASGRRREGTGTVRIRPRSRHCSHTWPDCNCRLRPSNLCRSLPPPARKAPPGWRARLIRILSPEASPSRRNQGETEEPHGPAPSCLPRQRHTAAGSR